MIRHGRHRTQRTLAAGLAGHLNPVSIKSAAQTNWSMYSQIELDRRGLLDAAFAKRKSRPKAALNSNLMIVYQAKRNSGFDFRR
jgi:hypothetical protein